MRCKKRVGLVIRRCFHFQPHFCSSRCLSKTRHAGTSSFAQHNRHLHTSAHLHTREGIPSDSRIAYGRGGCGAHLARAVKLPLFFSRLSHLGCANCSVFLPAGDLSTRADWRKWDESFLPGLLACVEGLRKKIGDVHPSLVLVFC